jgi:hypothetical protein
MANMEARLAQARMLQNAGANRVLGTVDDDPLVR